MGQLSLRATTKPVYHNYQAWTLGPKSHNYWALRLQLSKPACPRARALQQEKSPQWEAHTQQPQSSPRSLQLEKAYSQQWRPSTVNKFKKLKNI